MTADFHKSFDKQFVKLNATQKKQATDAIILFLESPMDVSLRNHPLKGEWLNYRSISASADLRIHYRILDETKVLFVAIGTHSQLYK